MKLVISSQKFNSGTYVISIVCCVWDKHTDKQTDRQTNLDTLYGALDYFKEVKIYLIQ